MILLADSVGSDQTARMRFAYARRLVFTWCGPHSLYEGAGLFKVSSNLYKIFWKHEMHIRTHNIFHDNICFSKSSNIKMSFSSEAVIFQPFSWSLWQLLSSGEYLTNVWRLAVFHAMCICIVSTSNFHILRVEIYLCNIYHILRELVYV